jgi:hypothetical protein
VAEKRKPNKVVLAVAIVHVTLMVLTWRDLQDRPAALVRGNKTIWRVASAVNTAGSAMYWLFGRRPNPRQRDLA